MGKGFLKKYRLYEPLWEKGYKTLAFFISRYGFVNLKGHRILIKSNK